MDLLGQETEKKQQPKGKKIVLMLLIISIILLMLVLVMIFALQGNKTKTLGLSVNGKDVQIIEGMLTSDESGVNYISLRQLSSLIGYEYLRGGYLQYIEDNTKCYLQDESQIIGFEANSNQIYKTIRNSETDYEYYKLNNNILQLNDVLYIALDDLNVACNAIYAFSNENYKIAINTSEYLLQEYAKTFTEKGLKINDDFNNKKAVAYNMIIVANESGRMGVVNSNLESIIGHKYTTMEFDEFSNNFIVSDENKYGIISKQGNIIADLKYESIRIINYSPLLYEVKLNNKYGVLNETGKLIVNIEYDKLGFTENSNLNEPTLIVENLNNDQDGIIVCKEGKYGIVSLKTGQTIINCEVDKIYSKTSSNGEKQYYIQLQNTEIDLDRYIEYINTTTVVTN